MRRLQSVMPSAVGSPEVLKAARAQIILRDWPEVVGSFLAERSCPDRFQNGVVWVAVSGSAWAQELRMMRETILERLNARTPETALFTNLRFGVRPLNAFWLDLPTPDPPPPITETELSIREIAEARLRNWSTDKRP